MGLKSSDKIPKQELNRVYQLTSPLIFYCSSSYGLINFKISGLNLTACESIESPRMLWIPSIDDCIIPKPSTSKFLLTVGLKYLTRFLPVIP